MVAGEDALRGQLVALPGMDALLPAIEGLPACHLVGGAVRDLLRGERSLDIDVAVEGDAAAVARTLAERLDGRLRVHERFGTATVRWTSAGGERRAVDLAATRRERYEHPGALPRVEPAGLEQDLARRDFTINAMAIGLSGEDLGRLHDPHGGREDIEAGLVRILHPRSFVDDPTRLLRALRYAARLGFELEQETERLAREAAAADATATVSGARLRDELLDLLAEHAAPDAVQRMRDLGVADSLHPCLRADPDLVAATALGSIETGATPALAGLAALCSEAPAALEPFVVALDLGAASRDAVLRAARRGAALAEDLRGELRPSQLHALLSPEPPEALALALALGAPAGPVLLFVARLSGVRLEISGDDLLAAGVPPGPALGRVLAATLERKLDEELSGREAELRAALELAGGRA